LRFANPTCEQRKESNLMPTLQPTSDIQVTEAVLWACAEEQPLELVGHGTRRGLGRPVQAGHTLDLSRLAGIVSYEPEELILVVRPGTPLAEVQAALAARGQALAFEPPDWAPLYGLPAGSGSIGGVISAGLSGPRRLKAGAARDHVLGVTAVSGRGEMFRAGGRVVKNVTGYDLPKLLTGAHGTLGVLTELVLKALPAPEVTRTLVLAGITAEAGAEAMAAALGSAAEVDAAAWLPADLPFTSLPPRTPSIVLRLEGPLVSVTARLAGLRALLQGRAAMAVLEEAESQALWAEIRDAAPFVSRPELIIWRASVAPLAGPSVLAAVQRAIPGAKGYLDWGGGLVWLSLPAGEARDGEVRRAVAAAGGGHATLIRAPEPVRAGVPVFQPEPDALAALSRRVKAQFDPKGVLNPGRMIAGV